MRLIKSIILLFLIHKVEKYARWNRLFENAGNETEFWVNQQRPGDAGIVHNVMAVKGDSSRIYGGIFIEKNLLDYRLNIDAAGLKRDEAHRKMFKISQRSNKWMIVLIRAYKLFYPNRFPDIFLVDFSKIKVDPMTEHMMERECYKAFIKSIRGNL